MLFGRARLLNGQSSTPNSNRGCQPALYRTGRLAALAKTLSDSGTQSQRVIRDERLLGRAAIHTLKHTHKELQRG